MTNCPVCFAEIKEKAIKCPKCLSYIKPRVNEGQFWGTGLIIGGILIGLYSYIKFLISTENIWLQMMNVGIFLAYLGFLVYGLGTFLSWFHSHKAQEAEKLIGPDKKECFFCGELIDIRAIKCNFCYSYLRQEKGKILATFVVVSGILLLTTAYILYLASNLQSIAYMQVGTVIIVIGIVVFMLVVVKHRYSRPSI